MPSKETFQTASNTIQAESLVPMTPTAWMEQGDKQLLDSHVVFNRGNGEEHATIYDAVNKRTDEGRVPVAVLEHPNGRQEEVKVADLLLWQSGDKNNSAKKLTKGEAVNCASVAKLIIRRKVELSEVVKGSAEKSRQDLLFEPYNRYKDSDEDSTPKDYSYLLADDETFKRVTSEFAEKDAARNRRPEGRKSTEEGINESAHWLEQVINPDLKQIISVYNSHQPKWLNSKELVERLRTDTELRKQVGEYLLQRMDDHSIALSMPPRVRNNTQKSSISQPGYEHIPNLKSREYAALLALSMLDGTFNPKLDQSDQETYDPITDKGTGQHRYAARTLLSMR